jgi:TIR domain-containing protein
MPIESPRYDVAISFLSKDEAIAAGIYQKLKEGLEVFFFPRSQEKLAGTDGLESMRKPFFSDSRVMVVLYRDPWGRTPWTRVEETAIKEACLEHGWGRLFFIVLDRESALPVWLPQTLVRFNYADFGLEQAVGAIKARVQENGGQHLPLTPIRAAEIFEAAELFRRDKLRMHSDEGIKAILNSVAELFRQMEKHCAEIKAKGFPQIRCHTDFKEHSAVRSCGMTDGRVGLTTVWNQPFSNILDRSSLVVREYYGGLLFPDERGQRMYINPPEQLDETKYLPDLSLARDYGWKEEDGVDFLSSSLLADRCVIRFVGLARRNASGKIQRGGHEF